MQRILKGFFLVLFLASPGMALSRFWVGADGTWDNSSTAHWSATSGGASGASAPTALDDVTINTSSGFGSGGTLVIAGSAACLTLTVTGPASKVFYIWLSGNFSPAGAVSISGNSAINRIMVQSNTEGTTRTLTVPVLTVLTNADFQDIAVSGAAAPLTGTSIGDCQGNSGITFTSPSTQTWTNANGGNWSTAANWTSRVPLPQDNASFALAFNAFQQVVCDMPRLSKNLDWTGATGTSPSMAVSTLNGVVYGSLTLIPSLTISATQGIIFSGRASNTITTAGVTWNPQMTINATGGTYTLQDALAMGTKTLTITNGTFNANNFAVSLGAVSSDNTNTRGLTMGTGVWSLAQTSSNIWNMETATGMTLSAANSIITISPTSASNRNFKGGGLTYGTLNYVLSGSAGSLTVSGSNIFANINFSDASNARTLTLTAGTTQTITGSFNVNGTSGKLMTINSSSGGSAATLSKAGGVVDCDYLSIQDSTATGGAAFYAGPHSTSVSGNTGWNFRFPPIGSSIGASAAGAAGFGR